MMPVDNLHALTDNQRLSYFTSLCLRLPDKKFRCVSNQYPNSLTTNNVIVKEYVYNIFDDTPIDDIYEYQFSEAVSIAFRFLLSHITPYDSNDNTWKMSLLIYLENVFSDRMNENHQCPETLGDLIERLDVSVDNFLKDNMYDIYEVHDIISLTGTYSNDYCYEYIEYYTYEATTQYHNTRTQEKNLKFRKKYF